MKKERYCLDNDRNAIDPIRMFKYLLLKVIFELSDNGASTWCQNYLWFVSIWVEL
ncbi:hypothetical protein J2T12_002925 [Paenibacillus anaericanus]|nr:hypothetical protein [Paenibacillus anaericanus]